ncbi:DUF551 domain-containing protein [Haemophilus haemolyticus]
MTKKLYRKPIYGDRWLVDSDEVTHWMPLPKPPID